MIVLGVLSRNHLEDKKVDRDHSGCCKARSGNPVELSDSIFSSPSIYWCK